MCLFTEQYRYILASIQTTKSGRLKVGLFHVCTKTDKCIQKDTQLSACLCFVCE